MEKLHINYCLLVVDMQKGIFGLKQPVYDGENIVHNVKSAAAYAREKGLKVIFSKHENDTFLEKATEGYALASGLEMPGDMVIAKKHPDVFKNTDLDQILKNGGITGIVIAGLISNGCVRAACLSAIDKHYDTILIKDAHSTFYKRAPKIIEEINREMEAAGVRIAEINELCAGGLF